MDKAKPATKTRNIAIKPRSFDRHYFGKQDVSCMPLGAGQHMLCLMSSHYCLFGHIWRQYGYFGWSSRRAKRETWQEGSTRKSINGLREQPHHHFHYLVNSSVRVWHSAAVFIRCNARAMSPKSNMVYEEGLWATAGKFHETHLLLCDVSF